VEKRRKCKIKSKKGERYRMKGGKKQDERRKEI
jgi:hypothetical protein